MTVTAVLLDLDGTLLDHDAAQGAALRAWLGNEWTPSLARLWSELAETHLAEWRDRRVSFQQQRRNRLRDFLPALGRPYVEAEADEVFAGFLSRYEAEWRAYDDVAATLEALAHRGVPTAVLTNGATEQQTAKLAGIGLLSRVGPVYAADLLGAAKPHAAAFLGACERLGVPPAQVLNVGDRHDLDVVAARAAGLQAVHLDRLGAGPLTEPSRITTLNDLLRFC